MLRQSGNDRARAAAASRRADRSQLRCAARVIEPKNGVSNHETHETHVTRPSYNAVRVHPAGERPSLPYLYSVYSVYSVVSTAVFRLES